MRRCGLGEVRRAGIPPEDQALGCAFREGHEVGVGGLGRRAEGKGQEGLGGGSEVRLGLPHSFLGCLPIWGTEGMKEQQAPTGSQPGPVPAPAPGREEQHSHSVWKRSASRVSLEMLDGEKAAVRGSRTPLTVCTWPLPARSPPCWAPGSPLKLGLKQKE